MNDNSKKLNRRVKISLLAAIAVILMFLELPIIPMYPWLELDLSELPVLLGGFGFGPIAAVVIELIKIVLILLIKGTDSGFVGEIANFIIGCSFILPATIIYKKNKTYVSAIGGMIVGIIFMNIFAIVANIYFLLPTYGIKVTPEIIKPYVLYGLIPINTLKGLLVSISSFLIFVKVGKYIFVKDENIKNKLKEIHS